MTNRWSGNQTATDYYMYKRKQKKANMESRISSAAVAAPPSLPLKEIPGSYGLPLVGLLQDRIDFFYTQGSVDFFKSRVKKLQSTVFRTHLVPTLPGLSDSKGIALTDSTSFRVLFDNSKVDKANVFVGPYSPPSSFTGGLRPLAYLDTTEPRHRVLKEYIFELIKSRGRTFMKEFEASFDEYSPLLKEGEEIVPLFASMAFSWVSRSFITSQPGKSPPKYMDPKVGATKFKKWVAVQYSRVIPSGSTGLPLLLEDILLRVLPLPFSLVKRDYEDICNLFQQAEDLLDMAEKQFSLPRDEALHNIVFAAGINMWLGFQKLLPTLVFYVANAGKDFQSRLGEEVRTAMVEGTSKGFMSSLGSMPLLQATVVEILRLEPPVQTQFARARADFLLESHDAVFQVRKGEMLCGTQALACRDPVVFDEPDKFMPDRFLGPRKTELMARVFWSNGRHTDSSSADNKQCAAKDLVFTVSMFFLALLFRKFQSLELDPVSSTYKVVLKSIVPV